MIYIYIYIVYNYTVNPMNPYINLYNTWDVCPCGRPPPESPSESTNAACWDWWMRTDEDVNQSHFGASGTINPSYQSSSVLWFGFWMLYMLLTVMTVMTLPQFGASGTIRDHRKIASLQTASRACRAQQQAIRCPNDCDSQVIES